MQICPECGKQTEGTSHNGRPMRCTECFARLPEVAQVSPSVFGSWISAEAEAKPEAPAKIEKGKRGR